MLDPAGSMGLLLSLPTDSIAVRAALASVVAVLLARLLLDGRLRSPRARAVVPLLPGAAIAVVVLAHARELALPSLWHTVEAIGGLTVPVRDTYLSFAPSTWPLVVGAWMVVVGVRLGVRCARSYRAARVLERQAAAGADAPPAVLRTVATLAAALQVPAPEVRVVAPLPGGAAVVGVRRPLLLLDAELLGALDAAELEGVLAHELAHVLRRDNLVAATLRVLRDVTFFVPGGRSSLRWLLREREHAADATAVNLTGRPGALASGLLKVIESASTTRAAGCSPLLSDGTLVARVQQLCDDRPAPSRGRTAGETATVVAALVVALAAGSVLPDLAAGDARERDALGLLLSDVSTDVGSVEQGRAAVFTAFDDAGTAVPLTTAGGGSEPELTTSALLPLDDAGAADVGRLLACEQDPALCPSEHRAERTVPMAPRPSVGVVDDLVHRWRLEPVVRSDNQQLGLFWFHRLPDADAGR